MNKKITYYSAVLFFIISAIAFLLIYKDITAKESRISLSISKRITMLKNIQIKIDESIKGIKQTEFPILRYGYSFNKNEKFFVSEIVSAGEKYGIKLKSVKLMKVNKKNKTADFYFKASGYGYPVDIYLFVKYLEYNYKINFKRFYISKNISKNSYVNFSSVLTAYVIDKHEVLKSIIKSRRKISAPEDFGSVDPFLYIIGKKKKNTGLFKAEPANHKKIKKKSGISEIIYKKLAKNSIGIKEYDIKKSDYYNRKGISLFSQNDLKTALVMFKKAVSFNPDNYRALSNAALDGYESKNYMASLRFANRALRLKKLWQINFILGLAYMKLKMFSKAEYNFKRALALNPSDGKIKYYLNISKKLR